MDVRLLGYRRIANESEDDRAVLRKKYTVKASMGHVRDLPKSQMGVDIDRGYALKYITIRGKGQVIKELKMAAKKAKKCFLPPTRIGKGKRSPGIWPTCSI